MSRPPSYRLIYSKSQIHDVGVQALAYGWTTAASGRGREEVVVTTGSDGLIKVWLVEDDRLSQKLYMRISAETDYVFGACAVSPAGTLIATASFDLGLRLWDAPSGRMRGAIAIEVRDIFSSLVFTPDSRFVVMGAFGGMLRVFDVEAKAEERRIQTTTQETLTAVAVSGCGKLVAAAGHSGAVHLLEFATGTPLHLMTDHKGQVTSLEFSPDSKRILSAGVDMHLILYDVTDGKRLKDFWDHESLIYTVSFSRDGRFFATGSNKEIRIWDCASLECLHIFTDHKDVVWGVRFNSRCNRLFSIGDDDCIKIFKVPSPKTNTSQRSSR